MGKRGPAGKPTELRLLHGDRKDRINTAEPQPSTLEVAPPDWLGAEGLELWERYAPDLQRKKVLTAWDVPAFAAWCDALARRAKAVRVLAAEGEVTEQPVFNKNGEVTGHRWAKSPWTFVLTEADAQFAKYAARFGLTPSDRAALTVGEAPHAPSQDLLTG